MGRISMPQGKGSQMHNRREYAKYGRALPGNIDASRTADNIVVVDRDLHELYDEIFGDAVKQYNAKQRRADRKIADYVSKIANSKNGENLFYEDILQYGSKEDFVDPKVREIAKKCLQIYAETFEQRNPCLRLLGAYIHMDEASPHLHIDYVPFATGYSRGMAVRNSLDKAMKQMGFVPEKEDRRHTATMLWKERERAYFADICREHGLVVEKAERGRGKSLSPAEYARAKDKMAHDLDKEVDTLRRDANRLKGVVKNKTKKVSKLDEQVTTLVNEINYNEMALAGTQADLARLDAEIEDRKKERDRIKDEIDTAQKHDDAVKALAVEVESTKQAYDAIKDHTDDDIAVIVDAFTNKKPISFGRNKGQVQITLPAETYTRFLTMARNAKLFERAWEVVGGLQERISHVVESAKMYYSKAQAMLEQARQERNETHRIASGETYKQEQAKLETLSRKKELLSRHVDDLEYKCDELQYTVDDLENRKKSLEKGISDIKDKRYQQAFITRYRDAFDDFVADQRKRERSYDDWER